MHSEKCDALHHAPSRQMTPLIHSPHLHSFTWRSLPAALAPPLAPSLPVMLVCKRAVVAVRLTAPTATAVLPSAARHLTSSHSARSRTSLPHAAAVAAAASPSSLVSPSAASSSPNWRVLLALGSALGVGMSFSTLLAAEKSTAIDPIKLHAMRNKPTDSAAGISDEGIVLTKLLKPTTGKPLVVLVACGSYSPITNMHLLVFEQARNYLQTEENRYNIIGGFLSPVHDAYGKSSLIAQAHRLHMCEAAVSNSEWLSVQRWEMNQPGWTTTADTLCKYQAALNNADLTDEPIRVKMLCGADLLESTLIPNLWSATDLDLIFGTFGVAVIERIGLDLPRLIEENEVLRRYKHNIDIVPQRITNSISSTQVRTLIRAQQSVRFLTPDPVIEYIYKHSLYGHDQAKHPPVKYLKSKF